MIRDTTVPAKECKCDKCGHMWKVYDGGKLPTWCRSCRSREWNGKKQQVQSHVHEIKLPAPRTGGRPKTVARTALFEQDEDQ